MHGEWCKYWTPSAYECYKRGCVCTGCPIQELMECRCDMKRAVIELVRKYGVPKKDYKLKD